MKLKTLAAATCFSMIAATASHAATYDYSYLFDDGALLAGALEGTLLSDANTIEIISMEQPLLNGALFGATLEFPPIATPRIVSLDGSDITYQFRNDSRTHGVTLLSRSEFTSYVNGPEGSIGQFRPENWEIAERAAVVPLPAGGLLLLSGLGGVAALKRRKKRAA